MDEIDWPAAATRFVALRLRPGMDLRAALTAFAEAQPEEAGFIAACVGSLERAQVRPAGQHRGLRVDGPLEIVGLSGTFSRDGPHLHVAVADGSGAMRGGHLLEGCPVRTTAEVVIGFVSGVTFQRRLDTGTGYLELDFLPRGGG